MKNMIGKVSKRHSSIYLLLSFFAEAKRYLFMLLQELTRKGKVQSSITFG
jgi:hypothetical protein